MENQLSYKEQLAQVLHSRAIMTDALAGNMPSTWDETTDQTREYYRDLAQAVMSAGWRKIPGA